MSMFIMKKCKLFTFRQSAFCTLLPSESARSRSERKFCATSPLFVLQIAGWPLFRLLRLSGGDLESIISAAEVGTKLGGFYRHDTLHVVKGKVRFDYREPFTKKRHPRYNFNLELTGNETRGLILINER